MFNPFKPLEHIETEVFMSLPGKFRKKARSAWSDPNRQSAEVECFLEGPSFDREGNLWSVDIPFGRIFRITPKGDWELVDAVRRLAQRPEDPQGRPHLHLRLQGRPAHARRRRPASSRTCCARPTAKASRA